MAKQTKIIIFIIITIILLFLIGVIILISNKNKRINIQEITSFAQDMSNILIEANNKIIISINDEKDNLQEINNEQEEKSLPIDNNESKPQAAPIKYDDTYYIKVNCLENVVTIYQKNDAEDYIPIKAIICSTGTWTPKSGTYRTSDKYTWGYLNGNVWGQYCTRITGSILFHSVPYQSKDKGTLEYWEYDKLGTVASQGCVRLTVADANWIYYNIPKGTQVEFYSDSNPSPLPKPSARKISDESDEYKNWDPTDLDENNPWKYFKDLNEEQSEDENISPEDSSSPEEQTSSDSKENDNQDLQEPADENIEEENISTEDSSNLDTESPVNEDDNSNTIVENNNKIIVL